VANPSSNWSFATPHTLTKAQLEFRLATAVKENKKSFYKYINSMRRTKDNFHPLLDAAGNVTGL